MRVRQQCLDASAIATNTPIFGKLNPDQNLNTPAPKIHECDHCFLYARNPYLVCAVHPTGPNTNTCIDFRENPDAEPEELWEPEGASYYNGELILQRPAAVDSRTTVRAARYPPIIYWSVQVVRQYEVEDVAERQLRKGANDLSIEAVREL